MQDNNRNVGADLIGKASIHDGKVLLVYGDGTWRLSADNGFGIDKPHYYRTVYGKWESVYWSAYENPSVYRSDILDKAYNDYVRHIMESETSG